MLGILGNSMDRTLHAFEGLIRRSIAPALTFVVVFLLAELVTAQVKDYSLLERVDSSTDWIQGLIAASDGSETIFGTVIFLLVLGLGNGVSATQQILFDSKLKQNFDPEPISLARWLPASSAASEGRALAELRIAVLERLDSEPWLERFRPVTERTDYLLYEILGDIDPTDTRPFVDTARSVGNVFSAAIAVTIWNLVSHWDAFGWWSVVLIVLIGVFYWLGREATVAQFRTRALRLYVNFLMMPGELLERRLLRPDETTRAASDEKNGGG